MYNNSYKKSGTLTIKVWCAVCFILFSFLWLYVFEADVIAVAQHALSGGLTTYYPLTGAIIITSVLFVVQWLVASFIRLPEKVHALTYVPSMLIIAFISDIDVDIEVTSSLGMWWLVPIVLVAWAVVVWFAHQMMKYERDDRRPMGLFSHRVWKNLLQMAVMMFFVSLIGSTNAVFHYSAHAEVALINGDTDEALRVGEESSETDKRLTMLRVFALSKKGQLGERLFNYPIAGTSEDMLPMQPNALQILSADSIWKHLGAIPSRACTSGEYYKSLERDSFATSSVADYRLCGCLIDRRLDDFVKLLPKYYEVADSLPLPRHYQEALVLYRHLRTHPAIIYHNTVVDEDWKNLKQLEKGYNLLSERKYRVYDHYSGSYWYYYFYQRD